MNINTIWDPAVLNALCDALPGANRFSTADVSAIWSNPRNALLGALLIALGVPAFLFWRRQNKLETGTVA